MDLNDPVILVCIFIMLIWAITSIRSSISNKRSKERAAQNGGVDPEKEKRQRALDDSILVKTKILDVNTEYVSKTSITNAVGRAVIGNMIAGRTGALIGAATADRTEKEHKKTTFRLYYRSGREKIVTVPNGSKEWLEYMDKLEEE